MTIINYLKTQMKIRKPFLYLAGMIIAFLVGILIMLIPLNLTEDKGRVALEKQVEKTVTLEKQLIKQELEWEKKLKKATKTVTIRKPDGTEHIVETTQEESQEAGKMVLDMNTLSQTLQLNTFEKKTEYLPNWSIGLGILPQSLDLGSYKNYGFSVDLNRRIFNNFWLGGVVFYDDKINFGVKFTYQF